MELELEKVKTIVYTSCVAVITLVVAACLIKFTRSSTKLMDRCGTKFEKIEDNMVKISEESVKASEGLAKTFDGTAKLVGNWISDEPSKAGSNGDNFGKILKNAAEISQVAKEKLVGDEGNKGLLENAYEVGERANNGLKNLNGMFFDTRTDKEKSDEEAQRKKKIKEEIEQMSDSANANDILSMPGNLPEEGMFNSNDSEQEASAESTQTCNIM